MTVVTSALHTFPIRGPAPREGLLMVLRDEQGHIGVGEAAPLPGYSRDTFAATLRVLDDCAASLHAIEDHLPLLEAVACALAPSQAALEAFPGARFAIETALLDLLARGRGCDVATGLRAASLASEGRSPSDGDHTPVEASALLTAADDPPALVRAGLHAVARGFRTLKVKLRATDDASLDREIESLKALRYAVPNTGLRLDPNGRWSVPDARRFLARLAPLAPLFVEQPVSPEDLPSLGPCAVPWAADESLADPAIASGEIEAAPHLTSERGCAAFVIKPAALGLRGALACVALARSRDLPVVITHFMDGPIGLAAACELALSLAPSPLPCGLAPHEGLRALPPGMLPHHVQPARVRATGRPGLGFSADAIATFLATTSAVWSR